jgi:hypothetical protein
MRKVMLIVSAAALFIGSMGTLVPPLAWASDQPSANEAALPGSAALCALALPEVLASTPILTEPRAAKSGEKFEPFEPIAAVTGGCGVCARSCLNYCQASGCSPVVECPPSGGCSCSCAC